MRTVIRMMIMALEQSQERSSRQLQWNSDSNSKEDQDYKENYTG